MGRSSSFFKFSALRQVPTSNDATLLCAVPFPLIRCICRPSTPASSASVFPSLFFPPFSLLLFLSEGSLLLIRAPPNSSVFLLLLLLAIVFHQPFVSPHHSLYALSSSPSLSFSRSTSQKLLIS